MIGGVFNEIFDRMAADGIEVDAATKSLQQFLKDEDIDVGETLRLRLRFWRYTRHIYRCTLLERN